MKKIFNYFIDYWDTKYLGFKVIKFNILNKNQFLKNPDVYVAKLLRTIKYNSHTYLLIRIVGEDIALVNCLVKNGFIILENLITFSKSISTKRKISTPVGPVKNKDAIEQLARLASQSFCYDRFHIDPIIAKEKADRLHYYWVKHSTQYKNKFIIAKDKEGKPTGFVLCRLKNKKAIIELVAVERTSRNHGIGTQLIYDTENYLSGKADTLYAATQMTNKPALNLYIKTGFQFDKPVYTLRYYKNGV
jgi:ribosomal protein S18 acetylase RimI-like enzyme